MHLDPDDARGLIVEIRWRGGSDLNMHFILYDDSDRVIQIASRTEFVRGVEGTTGCRQVNVVNGVPLGTGGTRSCFQLSLTNLSARCHRVALVAFSNRNTKQLTDLSRTWLTLHRAGEHPSKIAGELYACRSLDGGAYTAIAVAALTRRTGDVWIFRCLNEPILGAVGPHAIAPVVPVLFRDPAEFHRQHFALSREAIMAPAFALLDDAARESIIIQEEAVRRELAVAYKVEYSRAHKRSLAAQGMRAFTRRLHSPSRSEGAASTQPSGSPTGSRV